METLVSVCSKQRKQTFFIYSAASMLGQRCSSVLFQATPAGRSGPCPEACAGGDAGPGIFSGLDSGKTISNIVLMGIGEPLDNFDAVLRFLELVNHPDGMNTGMRHISLSTCGLIEKVDKLAAYHLQLTLSVSLHAPTMRQERPDAGQPVLRRGKASPLLRQVF